MRISSRWWCREQTFKLASTWSLGPMPLNILDYSTSRTAAFTTFLFTPLKRPWTSFDRFSMPKQRVTQYLSPAPAYPNSDWLTQFFDICQCQDSFPVILAHVYNLNPDGAIATIQNILSQFPGKPIWITEISPASSSDQGCTLDEAGMIDWMNQVIGWASQQSAIERIFWNCGEYVSFCKP